MKRFLTILTAALMLISCASCGSGGSDNTQTTTEADADGYKLLWSDEFDGDKLDESVWDYEKGYIRNSEPQYYVPGDNNVSVSDGILTISCRKEDNYVTDKGDVVPYTSASINTRENFSFTYGKVEMRAKLPLTECKACWPAFWMMGTSVTTINWPYCGEVDILEAYGTDPYTYYTTIHWYDEVVGAYAANWQDAWGGNGEFKSDKKLAEDWHTYGLEWDSMSMKFYCDGEVFDEFTITDSSMNELHEPMYVMLNLALTKEGDRTQLDNGEELNYQIDYVRVYQKEG